MKNRYSFPLFHFCPRGAQLLCLGLSLSLTNQVQAQGGPQLGIKAGPNLASYTGGGAFGRQAGWQLGVAAGALVTYPLPGSSGVQLEVLYSQKGAHHSNYHHVYQDPAFSSPENTYRVSLAYLDVPALYTFGPGSQGLGFFAAVGPQFSLALSKREFVRPRGEAAGGTHEEMLDANRRSLQPVAVGYVAGVGYQLANGLGAEVRYSGDFTPVYRPGYGVGSQLSTGGHNVRNAVLQLQVRFLFGAKSNPARPTPEHRPRPENRSPEPAPVTPSPAYLDSLYRDPQVRRVLEVLTILSWLDFRVGQRPVYRPGPSVPPPGRGIPAPRPRPRSRSERPTAY